MAEKRQTSFNLGNFMTPKKSDFASQNHFYAKGK